MRLALAHQAAASPNSHNAAPSPRRLDATAVSSPGGFRTPALRRAQPSCQGRIRNPSQERTSADSPKADATERYGSKSRVNEFAARSGCSSAWSRIEREVDNPPRDELVEKVAA